MMNQEDLFRKLGAILNELNDQYDYLARNPSHLNELELELFLANSNFLSEHIQIVKKINNSVVFKALPEHSESQSIAKSSSGEIQPEMTTNSVNIEVQEPEPEEIQAAAYQSDLFKEEQSPASFEFILDERPQSLEPDTEETVWAKEEIAGHTDLEQPEAITENKINYASEAVERFEIAQEEVVFEHPGAITDNEAVLEVAAEQEPFLIQKEEDKVSEVRTTLIEDKVEQKLVKPTLNDLLASSLNKGNPVSEQSGPSIKDLKQAINLNDKLLYIKDLFNGYNLAYAEAIELINKMPDFKSADNFLKSNYATKNNWSAKQATVDKFYKLLERRF